MTKISRSVGCGGSSVRVFVPVFGYAAVVFALRCALVYCASLAVSLASGTWTPLMSQPPGAVNTMLLLPDGTVMANDANSWYVWYRLTPDSTGSYVKGSWSTLASMHDNRLYYSSAVLTNGTVFVAGGEYGSGGNTAEVYDPVANVWTPGPPAPPGQSIFYDSVSKILPNGNLLISPVGPATPGGTVIYNTASNTFSIGPTLFRGYNQDEASWIRLADDSILTVDPFGTNSERYIPSLNQWVNDTNVPVTLYDPYGGEMGAGFVLADGRAFVLGATGNTALYTPSGGTNSGSWQAGPVIPNGQGTVDAPAAMMVNGKILCAVAQAPLNSSNIYNLPTTFYEYDPVSNLFARVNGPTGSSFPDVSYGMRMLDLPDGTVLFSASRSQLYTYRPDGAPLAAATPTILSVSRKPDDSFHLTGTMLGGVSCGAAYGDDAQMDSNYPLIRMTNTVSGQVYYARTFGWTSTSVLAGTNVSATEFRVPAAVPGGTYAMFVTVNGISSASVTFTNPATAVFANLATGLFLEYGAPSITLNGTLSGPGPAYPQAGETVSVAINGVSQQTTINDATGDFSIQYNLSGIPFRDSPYPITYSYAGDSSFYASSDSSTALILGMPPSIAAQPASQSILPGGTAVFSVGVAGPGPLTFRWQFNGVDLPNGLIQTVAGNGSPGYSGDGGAATNASLNWPTGIAFDAAGDLVIADEQNNSVRLVTPGGVITTIAGNGTTGYTGDGGPSTNATLSVPDGVSVDAAGNVLVADSGNNVVRQIAPSRVISTIAGNGVAGYTGDQGPATNASLSYPESVVSDLAGNLYIADSGNNVVRSVATNGMIGTVAGNGVPGYSGDGGPGTNASLNYPYGLTLDSSGSLLISDLANNVVRREDTNGGITTIVGAGVLGYSGDGGPAIAALLGSPSVVAIDRIGDLFIADTGNSVVRKVNTNGIITTVAGNGLAGYSGDGNTATNAELYAPYGLAFDSTGNLFIGDTFNNRVRKVILFASYPTLVLNNASLANAGNYSVIISNRYGSVTSSVVSLSVSLRPQPRFLSLSSSNGLFTFNWSSVSNLGYQVQYSTNLNSTNWSNLTNPITASSSLSSASDNLAGAGQRFYRVLLLP